MMQFEKKKKKGYFEMQYSLNISKALGYKAAWTCIYTLKVSDFSIPNSSLLQLITIVSHKFYLQIFNFKTR